MTGRHVPNRYLISKSGNPTKYRHHVMPTGYVPSIGLLESICERLLGARGGGYGDEAAARAAAAGSPVSRARGCECE
eukprot:6199004-Pleurochrysis_carterae.AAC.3